MSIIYHFKHTLAASTVWLQKSQKSSARENNEDRENTNSGKNYVTIFLREVSIHVSKQYKQAKG